MKIRFLVILSSLFLSVLNAWSEDRGAAPLNTTVKQENGPLYSKSYALVIGIDRYTDGWTRLEKAVEDANAVGDELESRGFLVTRAHNLRSAELEATIRDFIIDNGDDPEARLFVWFAGHGHTLNGNGYIVPADAPDPDREPKQFRRRALNMGNLAVVMKEPRAKHVMVVLDSCFSGHVITSYRGRVGADISRKARLPVRQFITSGSADQVVPDDGRFRKLFLRSIGGDEPRADQNKDGYVTGREIGEFLQAEVTNLTGEQQVPRIGTLQDPEFDDGDFIFTTSFSEDQSETHSQQLPLGICQEGLRRVLAEGQIRFEIGSSRLREESLETISAIARIINQCGLWTNFEISVHTEAIGAGEYNMPLTQARAATIRDRLIEMGVNASRLFAVGYGDSKPKFADTDEVNRILNRRVEIVPFENGADLEKYWNSAERSN